jgi:Helix-turn-helix domain
VIGQAPVAYLRVLRLERAAHDLVHMPEKTLLMIAVEAGYSSVEAFRRAFVHVLARSPSAVRARRAWGQAPRPEYHSRDAQIPKPNGLGAPELITLGPLFATSLRAKTFDTKEIEAAWRAFGKLASSKQRWVFGAATPPWGFCGAAKNREYRCLRFEPRRNRELGPPLEAWNAPAAWHMRFVYEGTTCGLDALMQWIFSEWLPGSGLRWRFAPVVTVFDNDVWAASAFQATHAQVHVPVSNLGLGLYEHSRQPVPT